MFHALRVGNFFPLTALLLAHHHGNGGFGGATFSRTGPIVNTIIHPAVILL